MVNFTKFVLVLAFVSSMASDEGRRQEKLLRQNAGHPRRSLQAAASVPPVTRTCTRYRTNYKTSGPSGYYEYMVQTFKSGPLNCEAICRGQTRCRAFIGNTMYCYLFESAQDILYGQPGCYREGGLCAKVTGNATFHPCRAPATSVVSGPTNVCKMVSASSSQKYLCYKDTNTFAFARWTNTPSCQSTPSLYVEFKVGSGCADEVLTNHAEILSCATHDISPLRNKEYTATDVYAGSCLAANFQRTSFDLSPQTACSFSNTRRYCSSRVWGINFVKVGYESAQCGGRQFRYTEFQYGKCVPMGLGKFGKHSRCGMNPNVPFPTKQLGAKVMGLKLYSDSGCTLQYGTEEFALGVCAWDGLWWMEAKCTATSGEIVSGYNSNTCTTTSLTQNIRAVYASGQCVKHNSGGYAKFWKCA